MAKTRARLNSRIKPKLTYKKLFHEYVDGEPKLKLYQKVGIMFLVVVIAGFAGWVWEFSLAEISGGFKHLYIKGGNLLPWINIYAIGAVVVIPVAYKLRKYPWAVFVVSALVTGVVELIGGWLAYELFDGARYWDYTKAWWGVGNIDGFVCPASAAVFGLGSLVLMYWLLPRCVYVAKKMSKRAFLTLTITLFTVVMADELTNLTLKSLGLPTAMNLYESLGFVFK